MKYVKLLIFISFLFISYLLLMAETGKSEDINNCRDCHTSAGKLINITREIAKTKPPAKSTEQEGVG